MAEDRSFGRTAPVPTGQIARLARLGGMASGIAGGMVADGLREIARGRRPNLAALLLTPANARRMTSELSRLRGAALKLGQMLSLDPGLVLPPEVASILGALREDARHMPPKQLQGVLDAEWGRGWINRFERFDVRPFAAASIGQVHRARTRDGRDLAVKVQYPGVRASIDSDVDNVATLLRVPGVLPRGMDLAPLLAEAKRQLREEADYAAEAERLALFARLLAGSDDFVVPDLHADLSTPQVIAMRYVESAPIDALAEAPQAERDRAGTLLVGLVLRELFEFRAMQTDPNLANYRYEPATRRIVLLDFGAVRTFDADFAAGYRALLDAGLDGGREATRAAMLRVGYFDAATPRPRQDLILDMFDVAMTPLRQETPFDFGRTDLLERLRDMGLALGGDRELVHVPPADALFLHRKIGGTYLLATRLRSRVALRPMLEPHRARAA